MKYRNHYIANNSILKIHHTAGFFSCSTIRLESILEYYNLYHKLPNIVDSSIQYQLYKSGSNDCVVKYFFKDYNIFENFVYDAYTRTTDYDDSDLETSDQQFSDYSKLNYHLINRFVIKYFSPSDYVVNIINKIVQEYNIDYNNTCVVFFRGNLKFTETNLPSYNEYDEPMNKIYNINKNIRYLFQSDETEFLNYMTSKYTNNVVFNNYIRHISKTLNTEADWIDKQNNIKYAINYLAITIIMSKCKYIICTSGNCSFWIMLFRGNSNNVIQYLNDKNTLTKPNCWIDNVYNS